MNGLIGLALIVIWSICCVAYMIVKEIVGALLPLLFRTIGDLLRALRNLSRTSTNAAAPCARIRTNRPTKKATVALIKIKLVKKSSSKRPAKPSDLRPDLLVRAAQQKRYENLQYEHAFDMERQQYLEQQQQQYEQEDAPTELERASLMSSTFHLGLGMTLKSGEVITNEEFHRLNEEARSQPQEQEEEAIDLTASIAIPRTRTA